MRFGIEYTFVPKEPDEFDSGNLTNICTQVKAADPVLFSRAYVDGASDACCLEIPSPPHRSLREAESFYKKMMAVVKQHPVTPRLIVQTKKAEEWYGTGGGHVHVELPKSGRLRRQTIYNLICMVANRPWLGWVFNEYMDDTEARALYLNKDVRQFMKGNARLDRHLDFHATKTDPVEQALVDLVGCCYAIGFRRWDDDMTVEMRFFDAPRSWQQTKEHVEFALAMVKRAIQRAKDNMSEGRVVDTMKEFNGFKQRIWAEQDFRATCEEVLHLDWEVYKKYMENFDLRREHGRMV